MNRQKFRLACPPELIERIKTRKFLLFLILFYLFSVPMMHYIMVLGIGGEGSRRQEFLLFSIGIATVFLPVALAWGVQKWLLKGSPFDFLTLGKKPVLDVTIVAILLLVLSHIGGIITRWLPRQFKLDEENFPLTADFIPGNLPSMLFDFYFTAMGAIFQELLYRVVMLGILMKVLRKAWLAILIQALFFGLHHIGVVPDLPRLLIDWNILSYIVGGTVLGAVTVWRRTALGPIVFHIITNTKSYFLYPDPRYNILLTIWKLLQGV